MASEYIVVEEAASGTGRGRRRRARPPLGPRQRVRRAGAVAAAATLVGLLILSDRGGPSDAPVQPVPTSVAEVEAAAVTAAQQATAIAYTEWVARSGLADCLGELGEPYEPRVSRHVALVPDVASFLGIPPVPIDPAAPSPELRHPGYYLDAPLPPNSGGACPMPRTEADLGDAAAVADAVATARVDEAFRAVIGEQEWLRQHPAEASHAVALLRRDGGAPAVEDPAAQARWTAELSLFVDRPRDDVTWIPVVETVTDDFAQASGLTASGGAVVIRVSGAGDALVQGAYMTTVVVLECGDSSVSIAARRPWGDAREAQQMADALTGSCGAGAADVA